MPEDNGNENEVSCPICGGSDIEEVNTTENSYGVFIKIYLCKICDVEFEKPVQI